MTDNDDFPWDAPIHVVRSLPIVERADQVPEGYTGIPVDWVHDWRLSIGARGLLIEIMGHGGKWDIDPEELAALSPDPEETPEMMRGFIAELEEYGYLEKAKP